jgi:hypothetical protein
MTELDRFVSLVHATFPLEPVPHRFFWQGSPDPIEGDVPEELQNRMAGRRWTKVTLMDWLMTGVRPHSIQDCLEPAAFLYYLPSLFIGVFSDLGYLDFGIEAILPNNKWHKPRGKWWFSFRDCVSERQRETLRAFLATARSTHTIGPVAQVALIDAEKIWNHDSKLDS